MKNKLNGINTFFGVVFTKKHIKNKKNRMMERGEMARGKGNQSANKEEVSKRRANSLSVRRDLFGWCELWTASFFFFPFSFFSFYIY